MVRVDIVVVPGVGTLRAFRTESDDKIAVLALPSGRRQLFVEDPSDPLQERAAEQLGEHLGVAFREQRDELAVIDCTPHLSPR